MKDTKPNEDSPIIHQVTFFDTLLQHKRKLLLGAAAGAFLVLIGLIILFLVLFNEKKKDEEDQEDEVTFTEEDLSLLTQGIRFTDEGDPEFEYQSPLYDFAVTVDTRKLSIAETSSGIRIQANNAYEDATVSIRADEPFSDTYIYELEKEVENFRRFIVSYESGEVSGEETIQLADTIDARKISYTYSTYSGKTQNGIAILFLYDGNFFQIEYKTTEESPILSTDEFETIASSFSVIDSDLIDQTGEYVSSLWGYSFAYPIKKMKLMSSSDSSVSLDPRDYDAEDYTVRFYSQDLSRQDLADNESQFLKAYAQERVNGLVTQYPSLDELVIEEVAISGDRQAFQIRYDLTPEGSTYYPLRQELFVLHYNAVTQISFEYDDSGSEELFRDIVESVKFFEPTSGQVKGVSTSIVSNPEERSILLARPSVKRIFSNACLTTQTPFEGFATETFCTAGFGSGFFVNSDGYVATNGHVVIYTELDVLLGSVIGGYNEDLIIHVFREYYEEQITGGQSTYLSDGDIWELYASNYLGIQDEIALFIAENVYTGTVDPETEVYVQKGDTSFQIDLNTLSLSNDSEHYKATIVDFDYIPDSKTSSDVALLKVDEDFDFPTLDLGTTDTLNIGSTLFAIGFPGIATDFELFAEESRGEATVTRGIVSAVKKTEGGRTIIQTDASILNGNSGGPSINLDAEVIGLVTYRILGSDSADFNLIRAVEDLSDLMEDNNVKNSIGSTESLWREANEKFWSGQFSSAITDLKALKKQFPDLVEADNLIEVSEKKIAQGVDVKDGGTESETGEFNIKDFIESLSQTEKILFGIVGGMGLLILILLLLFITMLGKNRGKSKQIEMIARNQQILNQNQQKMQQFDMQVAQQVQPSTVPQAPVSGGPLLPPPPVQNSPQN